MSASPESIYRDSLADGPDCLVEALESVIPTDPSNDDPATRLTRQLCFEPNGESAPFSQELTSMLNHGLRQIALGRYVLNNPDIRQEIDMHLDLRLVSQALITADVGLLWVPRDDVENVLRFGPKVGKQYIDHPQHGYEMAQEIIDPNDPKSQFIAAFDARHHMLQARNAYGLEWHEINHDLIDPEQVDLAVALTKPLDYFDDTFGRHVAIVTTYSQQAEAPRDKFIHTYGTFLRNHPTLRATMEKHGINPALPSLIARQICRAVVDTESCIGEVYRQVRPDLAKAS